MVPSSLPRGGLGAGRYLLIPLDVRSREYEQEAPFIVASVTAV